MTRLAPNNTRLVFILWHRAIFEALRAGLILGGLLYGGIIFPFFMTAPRGFHNFFGEFVLGLGVGIPLTLLTAFIIGACAGFVIVVVTILFFYMPRQRQNYRLVIGLIGLAFSVAGVSTWLAILRNAPYYAYDIFSWAASDITIVVLAGLSSWWATYRFARWYSNQSYPLGDAPVLKFD